MATDKLREALERISKAKPDRRIAVWECIALFVVMNLAWPVVVLRAEFGRNP